MERWFSNLKKCLKRHLERLEHHQNVATFKLLESKTMKSRKEINEACMGLIYYVLKSKNPFAMYPVLLAVAHRANIHIGNINHTRMTCSKLLEVMDIVLKKRGRDWVNLQGSITITADIGTVASGLSLLTTVLISDNDGSIELAGFSLVPTKEGEKLAENIYETMTGTNCFGLNVDIAKDKISGVAGDGAFIKGNAPFKARMKQLFHENLKFRWDMLHLVNRAYSEAREFN